MTPELLLYTIILFMILFGIGTLLCLQLFRWEYSRFFRSALWTKVLYWIPIFIVYLVVLWIELWAAVALLLLLSILAIREMLRVSRTTWVVWMYGVLVIFALSHLVLFYAASTNERSVMVLLLIGFSSVLSDVCAYFFGNFFGRHKLPVWINRGKSWEGVAGQIIGAGIGYLLVLPILLPIPHPILALVIGIASAIGDIVNSIVKRQAGIKDWGATIPGHGGVLDRFASLSFAIAAAYWWTILT